MATPFGEVGLLEAYAPDVTLLHAPVADRQGNLAFNAPGLEGVWGALAARRGVVATVDRVVDDIRPWSHLVKVPGHRVLAVAETPMGAHPGGLFARDTPVDPYGEDLEFWAEARAASHGEDFDAWIEHWVLGARRPGRVPRPPRHLNGSPGCGVGRPPTPGVTTRRPIRPTSTRRWWRGRRPPSTGPATSPTG